MELNNYNLWTALITPLNEDNSIDFESFQNLIDEQVNANNGLLILGSTGESLNLNSQQKIDIVNYVCDKKPNSPIMIGVGGHDIDETLNWLNFLETKPIDCYLMVTPLYSKPGDIGQYKWFSTLLDSVTKPAMLYNVPSRTGTSLSISAVEKLKDHKNFWAIKEASGNVEDFKNYLSACGNKPVFCGDDGLFPEFASAGSHGLISVSSNVWPNETNLYTQQCLNNSFDAKQLWTTAANTLFEASNPVPTKVFMAKQGRIKTSNLMPPLTHEDLGTTKNIDISNEQIKKWFETFK